MALREREGERERDARRNSLFDWPVALRERERERETQDAIVYLIGLWP